MALTFSNVQSNPLAGALQSKIKNPGTFTGQNTGIQTSTPYSAQRAAPTPIQSAYGQAGSVTGYSGAPNLGTNSTGSLGLYRPSSLNQTSTTQHTSVPSTSVPTTPPAYDTTTGLLTDYGRSKGLPEVNNHQQNSSQNSSQNTSTSTLPDNGLYSTIVNKQANQDNSPYNQAAQSAITSINNAANGNQQYADRAKQITDAAGSTVAQIGREGARGEAGYLSSGIPNSVAVGNAGIIAQNVAAQQQAVEQGANIQLTGNAQGLTAQQQTQSGFNAAAGQALAGQGTAQGALNSAAGFAAPQPYGLTTQPYNPVTDTYGGGGSGGAVNRSVQASNIGAAADFNTKIQNIQATKGQADANFNILNSLASQGGVDQNSPILSTLRQKYGTTVGGGDSAAVQTFLSQLQTVRAQYQQLTGASDATQQIPDSITPAGLKAIQQSLNDSVQNQVTGYQNQLHNLQGGGTGANDPLGIL